MILALTLSDYRKLIALDEVFVSRDSAAGADSLPLSEKDHRDLLEALLAQTAHLCRPDLERRPGTSPRERLHIRFITRGAFSLTEETLCLSDRLFAHERSLRPVFPVGVLPPSIILGDTRLILWQGDIRTLEADAIVNAANSELLGCFQPSHRCIDHAIHAAAGPRLRDDCARIRQAQKGLEPSGGAKITRAYHLPSRFVLHTVGPVYRDPARHAQYADELGRCYTNCLDTAADSVEIRSLAFCCIATGLYGFPNQSAAQIALDTVIRWVRQHPGRYSHIVFNVFLNKDLAVYRQELFRRIGHDDQESSHQD